MKRLSLHMVLVVFVIALTMQTIPAQAFPVSTWAPIYDGIRYATGYTTSPRLMRAFAVKIDLQNPNVQIRVSPHSGSRDTTLQPTDAFLSTYGCKVAANASFWDTATSPDVDVLGFVLSNGNLVSNAQPGYGWLAFTTNNTPEIGYTAYNPSGKYAAVSGSGDPILINGSIVTTDPTVNPYTAYGLTSDNRYLIILCVDGRQSNWSLGCSVVELAQWLLDFGAWNGIRMDGGGSTCMVREDVGVVTHPCYGYVRPVAVSLGVYSIAANNNPPYEFTYDPNGWYSGNHCTSVAWQDCCGWPGIINYDQTGNDCWVYGPACCFVGAANETIEVHVYPQWGSTSSHDMQVFWKTNEENYWDAAKSSSIVNYTAMDSWAVVDLDVNNAKWIGKTINQIRLDTDQVNHGNRWIVDSLSRITPTPPVLLWNYDSSVEGWYAGQSLTPLVWYNEGMWTGIIYSDQTANDAYMYGPATSFPGTSTDVIHVRVYPQNGNTTSHDMRVYWISTVDTVWSDSKSVLVTYTGKDQWVDVYVPVGTNANWVGKVMTRIRVDFDQVNHGNRWIVDSIHSQ